MAFASISPAVHNVPANNTKCNPNAVHGNGIKSCNKGREESLAQAKALMKERVDWINSGRRSHQDVGTFFIGDLGEVWRKFEQFKAALPGVEPHYAVKANPETAVLQVLAAAGSNFDCASMGEVERALALGVHPSQIIFAHPRVHPEQIYAARARGVEHFVFDSIDELDQAVKYFPDIKYIIRFAPNDSSATVRLGDKFGIEPEDVEEMLYEAKSRGINIVGVSFHIGSDAKDADAYTEAIEEAAAIFHKGNELGFDFRVLDIGGGYTRECFEDMAATIRRALDRCFPDRGNLRVIAEPGRFFVSSAFTIATRILGRKPGPKVQKYNPKLIQKIEGLEIPDWKIDLSDGVYGALNNFLADHQTRTPQILSKADPSVDTQTYLCWGPTCDSFDKPIPLVALPGYLKPQDWVYFEDMGAYTIPCSTTFNDIEKAKLFWTSTEPKATALVQREEILGNGVGLNLVYPAENTESNGAF